MLIFWDLYTTVSRVYFKRCEKQNKPKIHDPASSSSRSALLMRERSKEDGQTGVGGQEDYGN